MASRRLRFRIFMPLVVALIVMLGVSMLTLYKHQHDAQYAHARQHCLEIPIAFSQQIQNDTKNLNAQLDYLLANPALQQKWLQGERESLLTEAVPLYEKIRNQSHVTHFYFHTLDQHAFLRVHHPERYGDQINRHTLGKAAATATGASGLELGPLGTFTLRVVRPWVIDGQLVGYLELGEEINHIFPEIYSVHGIHMVLTVDKSRLDRVQWEEGNRVFRHNKDWDQYTDVVVAGTSMRRLPDLVDGHLQDSVQGEHRHGDHQQNVLKNDQERYVALHWPLLDAGDDPVGQIHIFYDITELHQSLTMAFMKVLVSGVSIVAILLVLLWVHLGRTQRDLESSRRKLTREIQDHQEALVNLKASEERIKIILNMAADGMILGDINFSRIVDLNTTMATMLGYTEDELKGQSPGLIHPDDTIRLVKAEFDTFTEGRHVLLKDIPLRRKDGSMLMADLSGSVFDLHGEKVALGVFRDNSESRHLELQLESARKMESVGQLAAGIAHEINTPTQFVGDNIKFMKDAFEDLDVMNEAYAKLLEAAKSGGIRPELIKAVEDAIEEADLEFLQAEIPNAFVNAADGVGRVSKIVRAMKEFSHPGSDGMAYSDINDAIETTVTVARNEWKYVADMELDLDKEMPAVPCVVGQINQVFLNLIVNAAHAIGDVTNGGADSRGKITVSSKLVGDVVEIRVADTGGGMPDDIKARVFEPFFTTKEVGKGSGQGLAIAHNVVVKKHGGEIAIESEVGKGTEFIIRLPAEAEVPVSV
jgi:PAS domain S-box-containing protein